VCDQCNGWLTAAVAARRQVESVPVIRRPLQISGQGEETVICGLLADQRALHGLLTKVRDQGSA
jgi:hypothetical protein